MTEVKIVRKKDDRIEPEGGFRMRIKSGDTVKLSAQEGGSGGITFDGSSPFGDTKTVRYGTTLPLTARFVADDPERNVYPFTCELTLSGKVFTSKAGGEIEIIKP